MPAIFLHLSDIHFGQEHGERVHTHADVKEQLILDAGEFVRKLPAGVAHGILVTGDIAQSGKSEQYDDAANWLDRLARAVGCEIFRIQMVPGNHDLDRDKVSSGAKHILKDIKDGATEYESILANDVDRACLFARFEAYGRFADGYDCALDKEGKFATNLRAELAPGRSIRFVRMNSALLCTGEENCHNPALIIGARQFTFPRADAGEEIIVLIHHPLNWFKDSQEASNYLKSRARVLISGHEHNPKVNVERIEDGADLLMLAAGATVPYKSNEEYTFTYNIIEFDWSAQEDALAVSIHPRAWNPQRTSFEEDSKRLGAHNPRFTLGSPNFRRGIKSTEEKNALGQAPASPLVEAEPMIEMVVPAEANGQEAVAKTHEAEGYRLLLLRFFRDLTVRQRLHILVKLDAIPTDSDEPVTQMVQRKLFDWLIENGRISEVKNMVDGLSSGKSEGE